MQTYVCDSISLNSSYDEKCFKVVEKLETFCKNCDIYEIMWKNVV
jgi:hypothetical protein